MPERKTVGAAGYDLYLPETVVIRPGRNVVPLGFAMEMPQGWFASITARSGFSANGMANEDGGLRFDADVIIGRVDEDYRGEVGAIVKSNENITFCLHKGTRIAQMIMQRCLAPEFVEVEELDATDRADGGFGHTGTKD